MRIDLNSDIGESFGVHRQGDDAAIIPLVSSANIACGFHAGDPLVMDETVRLCAAAGVRVGAHPGHLDLQGFGRRDIILTPEEAGAFVLYQTAALAGFARAHGVELTHVKPHGALYNQAARDPALAAGIARGVRRFSAGLVLVGLAGSALVQAGIEAGLAVMNEGFPDRGYNPDGTLMARRLPGALLRDPQEIAAAALRLATQGIVFSAGGQGGRMAVDTLCLHGDNPAAVEAAQAVRAALQGAGMRVGA